jgi:hypothetical protein
MRFSFPRLPAEFEIPDDWWSEAGMTDFTRSTTCYLSTDATTRPIPLRDIEPPFREREFPHDFRGFDRARMVRILAGFVAGADIKAVSLIELPAPYAPQPPFRYRVYNGFHRFYASVAAGFECLPGKSS